MSGNADEVDWLHIDLYWDGSVLSVQSDPPLERYLEGNSWAEQLALSTFGLA